MKTDPKYGYNKLKPGDNKICTICRIIINKYWK